MNERKHTHFLPSKLRKPMMVFAPFFTSCCFASFPIYCLYIISFSLRVNDDEWEEEKTCHFLAMKRDRAGDLPFAILVRDTFRQTLLQNEQKKHPDRSKSSRNNNKTKKRGRGGACKGERERCVLL